MHDLSDTAYRLTAPADIPNDEARLLQQRLRELNHANQVDDDQGGVMARKKFSQLRERLRERDLEADRKIDVFKAEMERELTLAEVEEWRRNSPWPWIDAFDDEDLAEFADELGRALDVAIRLGDDRGIAECLDDWKTTADAVSDDRVRAVLLGQVSPEDFFEADRPTEKVPVLDTGSVDVKVAEIPWTVDELTRLLDGACEFLGMTRDEVIEAYRRHDLPDVPAAYDAAKALHLLNGLASAEFPPIPADQ